MATASLDFARRWLAVAAVLVVAACGNLVADYSLEAYKNATSLKAETLALVEKSGDPYPQHRAEAEALTTRLHAAYEFAAGIPQNSLSARQYAVLLDPDRSLYAGFIVFWYQQGTLGSAFREQFRGQLAEAFDTIICLEANKQKASACSIGAEAGT